MTKLSKIAFGLIAVSIVISVAALFQPSLDYVGLPPAVAGLLLLIRANAMRVTTLAMLWLASCSPELSSFTYTKISQDGATWESKEMLQQTEDGLIHISEEAGTCDTFKGEWHRENDTLVFHSSGDFPVTFIFARDGAAIIWYDGLVTRLTNRL